MNEAAHSSQSDEQKSAAPGEIVAIANALDDWYTSLGRQFGPLSRPQRRTLHLLSKEQEMRVSDLAETLGQTTAGATRMLDKLESLGYAVRTRGAYSDQRQVYVTLTAAGQQALNIADTVFCERVQISLGGLNESECATLARLLHTMQTSAATSGDTGASMVAPE